MPKNVHGRLINQAYDPPPYSDREEDNIIEIYGFLPDNGDTFTDRNHHSYLWNTNDTARVVICSDSDRVSINDQSSFDDTFTVYRKRSNQGIAIASDTNQDSNLKFDENGSSAWLLGYDATNRFRFYDYTRAALVMELTDNNDIIMMPYTGANNIVRVAGSEMAERMSVRQGETDGALAVLGLRQDDTDQEFIYMQGTAGAASITTSFVDAGFEPVGTTEGWLKIEILDAGDQIADGTYYVPFDTITPP